MKYFLTVLVAGVAVLAGCSGGPPPVDAHQLEEREDGLMYFEGEPLPFTGNASSKKEDFSIMTDYKDGKAISSRYWNKYGILTKKPTMNAGTKAPVLVAGEEPKQNEELTRKRAEVERKQHEALIRKQVEEEQKRNQELAMKRAEVEQKQHEELTGKHAEEEQKRNQELAMKRAEVERKQHEALAGKHAEESVKAIPKTIDFDDPETRRKIAEAAIYKSQSQRRGNKGEELLHFRDNTTPYSGWWKEMRGKGNGYSFETLVQYKDGKRDGPMAHWYKNGQKKLEHTYKDGKKHGLSRGWHNNGGKWWEETCKDGKWDGLRTNWYDNGQKKQEETYRDGRKHGPTRGWHKNGQQRWERPYKDGERDGSSTWWYSNGQKEEESTWKDGKLITYVVWKRNGEECPVTNIVNGNGFLVKYHDDGKQKRRETYRDGELVPH